jgi:hypothetical protein
MYVCIFIMPLGLQAAILNYLRHKNTGSIKYTGYAYTQFKWKKQKTATIVEKTMIEKKTKIIIKSWAIDHKNHKRANKISWDCPFNLATKLELCAINILWFFF